MSCSLCAWYRLLGTFRRCPHQWPWARSVRPSPRRPRHWKDLMEQYVSFLPRKMQVPSRLKATGPCMSCLAKVERATFLSESTEGCLHALRVGLLEGEMDWAGKNELPHPCCGRPSALHRCRTRSSLALLLLEVKCLGMSQREATGIGFRKLMHASLIAALVPNW